ncbi:MAG: hypothetical protein KF688_12835 [Pirellulales bacterium]|nr:hypothetical protein [Pirellulales bacterium]
MLLLVVAAMGYVRRPETVDRLGRVFGLAPARPALSEPAAVVPAAAFDEASPAADPFVPLDAAWDEVKDNAPFRAKESPAWFAVLKAVGECSVDELAAASLGETTFAQLRTQPEAYRGRVVTLRGVVRQVARQQAPANDQGIESYDQLWLAPAGGGQWPLVVYVLGLPGGFPRGDELREPATIHAVFFKNWSYSYGDGLGLAPVAVAKSFAWSSPSAAASADDPAPQRLWPIVLGALAIAAAGVAYAARRTRRPRRAGHGSAIIDASLEAADVRERLERLAERESSS